MQKKKTFPSSDLCERKVCMDVDAVFKIRREKSPIKGFLLISPKINFQIRDLQDVFKLVDPALWEIKTQTPTARGRNRERPM